jgi:hypothetical protein
MHRFPVVPLALAGGLLLGGLAAQQDFAAKRDAKLESAFLKNATWVTDYDQALALAKQEKKLIFAYFTRSYAP